MASVQRAPVRINCFAVEDAIEAPGTMVKLLLRHYIRGVLTQVHKLAGSMAAIGNPVDLASNVGGGIKDFFYEPMNGLVLGPGEFFKGAGRGVKSLGTGVVHGVTSSLAGVGNTVNRQLGMLTFDNEYQQQVCAA